MCKIVESIIKICLGGYLLYLSWVDYKEREVELLSLGKVFFLSILLAGIRILSSCQEDLGYLLLDSGEGLLIGLLFLAISLISKESIGYGDSLLIVILGIAVGAWELVILLQVTTVALLIYLGVYSIRHGMDRKLKVAFYPFLSLGYLYCCFH